ncbi:MAG: hypothetical protein V7661_05615 [Sulfitobacter sp.]
MANLAKMTVLTSTIAKKERPLDKTTRIVRRITEDETEVRHRKTARLRKARFESEADTHDTTITAISGKERKRC